MKKIWMTFLLGSLSILSCSSSSNLDDGGPTDTMTQDGADVGDGSSNQDFGSGENFALIIPANTHLCSMYNADEALPYDYQHNMKLEYQLKGRITLKANSLLLERDKETFQADLFEQIEFGPDQSVLVADGPGSGTRTIRGTATNGVYRYQFTQSFHAGGEPYQLSMIVDYEVVNGTAKNPVVTLDEPTISQWEKEYSAVSFQLKGTYGQSPDLSTRGYTTCQYGNYYEINHSITAVNGDKLTLKQKLLTEIGETPCKVCPSALVQAVFERGGQKHEATSHFRMAYTAVHHNWGQKFLIVFDVPVDSIHGLLLEEGITTCNCSWGNRCVAKRINFLDQDLNVTGSTEISVYQHSDYPQVTLCDPP